jgi:hypothetical protein
MCCVSQPVCTDPLISIFSKVKIKIYFAIYSVPINQGTWSCKTSLAHAQCLRRNLGGSDSCAYSAGGKVERVVQRQRENFGRARKSGAISNSVTQPQLN